MPIRPLIVVVAIATAACGREANTPAPDQNVAGTEAVPTPNGLIKGTPDGDLDRWVADIRAGIAPLPEQTRIDAAAAGRQALDLYIGRQEYIEMYYGEGGRLNASAALGAEVEAAETRFHELMKLFNVAPVEPAAVAAAVKALDAQQVRVLEAWRRGKARLDRDALAAAPPVGGSAREMKAPSGPLQTSEMRGIKASFDEALAAYQAGDVQGARTLVLGTYLDQFEPIESRLPASLSNEIEHLIHVQIRPAIERGESSARLTALMKEVQMQFALADAHLARGGSFWFAALNSFVIILREGLEAVLLIGALLGYLAATGAPARHRRQIWGGVIAGVAATLLTWAVASALIPIDGANRELIEGATALIAVAVLLYVSNWLFQKTYIHDWKNYLRDRLDTAVSSKSTFAMMVLAFAAVYREGFETVLFYQALAFDANMGAVMSGFLPGMLLIALVGVLIIRAGARLPLKQMFGVTNAILVYLSFVFVGKGLYNLHEAGVFAARQLPLPDVQVLRLLFGWYPLLETTLAQALYLTLVAGTFVFYKRRVAVSARRMAG